MSQSRQVGPAEQRPAPPPREADDRQVTLAITIGWVLALIVLLSVRSVLPADVRWWIWTCTCGAVMGLFGLWYVPFLKRRRTRIAAERAAASTEPQSGAQASEPASGYVSRDNGSKTVSSTETPGKSTRS
ncbi:MAG TPA: DUF2530 domain-containing protein [Trebonia sp.]|nr:DUF2530 domain-containing protein [Trebonia sp.]